MKNSAAERSGVPISHKVGPSLGGLYISVPASMLPPAKMQIYFHEQEYLYMT